MLAAARDVVRCDAAALLWLDGDVLVPVAVDGLSDEALGRRFPVPAHPRLARLLESPSGLRFEPDCGLPDPYDGLRISPEEAQRWTDRSRAEICSALDALGDVEVAIEADVRVLRATTH